MPRTRMRYGGRGGGGDADGLGGLLALFGLGDAELNPEFEAASAATKYGEQTTAAEDKALREGPYQKPNFWQRMAGNPGTRLNEELRFREFAGQQDTTQAVARAKLLADLKRDQQNRDDIEESLRILNVAKQYGLPITDAATARTKYGNRLDQVGYIGVAPGEADAVKAIEAERALAAILAGSRLGAARSPEGGSAIGRSALAEFGGPAQAFDIRKQDYDQQGRKPQALGNNLYWMPQSAQTLSFDEGAPSILGQPGREPRFRPIGITTPDGRTYREGAGVKLEPGTGGAEPKPEPAKKAVAPKPFGPTQPFQFPGGGIIPEAGNDLLNAIRSGVGTIYNLPSRLGAEAGRQVQPFASSLVESLRPLAQTLFTGPSGEALSLEEALERRSKTFQK